MNIQKNVLAGILTLFIIMGLLIYGVQTGTDVAQAIGMLILAFVIGDGFATYYGFYKLPSRLQYQLIKKMPRRR